MGFLQILLKNRSSELDRLLTQLFQMSYNRDIFRLLENGLVTTHSKKGTSVFLLIITPFNPSNTGEGKTSQRYNPL